MSVNRALTFNRTSMESKQTIASEFMQALPMNAFNRTSMESKLKAVIGDLSNAFRIRTFNRTSMESKLVMRRWSSCYKHAMLLIEPVWNRNPG